MHWSIHKRSVQILIATVFGLLVAATFTHLQGPCTATIPGENSSYCVEFSKAVMHPKDLISNKQNTLVRFAGTFTISSLAGFALLSVYSKLNRR